MAPGGAGYRPAVRFRRDADLEGGQVRDRRGAAPMVAGGGGLVGIIVLVLTLLNGGGGGGAGGLDPLSFGTGQETDLAAECQTGADANQSQDCRVVGVVNSIQAHWSEHFDGYRRAETVLFSGGVNTACGSASSAVGPFYCPPDQTIYIDLGFFEELETSFGASGGPFAEAYVIAHEYGHHVENLLGILERSRDGDTGPDSAAVKVELMADCLAGAWANGAVATGFIEELTDQDIRDGLSAAAAVGDDRIQEKSQGQVNPEAWTHGSAEMRQQWFMTGYRSGTLEACDTFA